jgi:hypothetical protein
MGSEMDTGWGRTVFGNGYRCGNEFGCENRLVREWVRKWIPVGAGMGSEMDTGWGGNEYRMQAAG